MTAQTARTALMASVLFAFAGLGFGVYGFVASGRVRTVVPSANATATADALQAAFVSVAERVRPAVVNIGTVQMARGRRPPSIPGPGTDDPFFKDFFDQFFGRGGSGRRRGVPPAGPRLGRHRRQARIRVDQQSRDPRAPTA